ncbi:MAG: FHA domain-containing protein, partial [Vicinamibacteria bacterium]
MAKIVVRKKGAEDFERELGADTISVGRDAANDIVLADSSVSRRHARIEKTPSGHYRIIDLDSGNGLLHQGRRVASLDLYPGCEVEVGSSTLRFESDAAVPVLVLIGGAPQRSYPIVSEETFLGRVPENQIAVPDPLVSSRHLKIVRKGNIHAVVDLESENGTRVNGVRVSSRELRQGDQIQVGGFTFFFALDGVIPEPDSVRIVQSTQTSSALPAISPGSAPPAPAPAPAASAKPVSSSRPRLLLIAAGLFAFLFFIVIFLLVRSPDDATEREFQDVFQADLNAEEQARIEEYLAQAKDYEASGNLPLALEGYRKILVLNETHHEAQAETARLEEALEIEAKARAERERMERERSTQVATLA